jgi:hypothetical protein
MVGHGDTAGLARPANFRQAALRCLICRHRPTQDFRRGARKLLDENAWLYGVEPVLDGAAVALSPFELFGEASHKFDSGLAAAH